MTSSTRIPAAPVTGLYGAIVKFAARRMVGHVPDSIGVMWHNRAVMNDSMKIGRTVEGWKALDADLSSYATMAAAATVGCSFCLDLNYFMAHNAGLDESKVRQVPVWRTSTAFTPVERRVMEYAEAASQTPPTVTDELSDALLADLGPSALVELAARVSFTNMTGRMNLALGIHSEQFADACGLAPLATRWAQTAAEDAAVHAVPATAAAEAA